MYFKLILYRTYQGIITLEKVSEENIYSPVLGNWDSYAWVPDW
jgi:hypothetical protein